MFLHSHDNGTAINFQFLIEYIKHKSSYGFPNPQFYTSYDMGKMLTSRILVLTSRLVQTLDKYPKILRDGVFGKDIANASNFDDELIRQTYPFLNKPKDEGTARLSLFFELAARHNSQRPHSCRGAPLHGLNLQSTNLSTSDKPTPPSPQPFSRLPGIAC